jgi:hypothetical protein
MTDSQRYNYIILAQQKLLRYPAISINVTSPFTNAHDVIGSIHMLTFVQSKNNKMLMPIELHHNINQSSDMTMHINTCQRKFDDMCIDAIATGIFNKYTSINEPYI